MRIEWVVSPHDVSQVQALMLRMADNAFLRHRDQRLNPRGQVTREELWAQLLNARLTTLQRAGPGSPVARFSILNPYPLPLVVVQSALDAESVIRSALRTHGGIRFVNKIGTEMAANLAKLLASEGDLALDACNRLVQAPGNRAQERDAAERPMKFVGFGPKQSRNVLQSLGLSRYEIPLDSRVAAWLNKLEFPVRLQPELLANRDCYNFVLDGVNRLCDAAGVLPCRLDAAIFAEKDGDAWTPDSVTD